MLIKAVIFVTFWQVSIHIACINVQDLHSTLIHTIAIHTQGIAIAVLIRTGTIDGRGEAEDIQNLLVCAEMLMASLCMMVAFPWVRAAVCWGGEP